MILKKVLHITILLFCLQIKYNYASRHGYVTNDIHRRQILHEGELEKVERQLETLEVNTDYADYKELNEGKELELTCKNNVERLQAVQWTPPSKVPHHAYSLGIKDGTYTLTLKKAKREYAGKYTCTSYTRNGEQLTKDIHVGINPKIAKVLIDGIETENGEGRSVCEKEVELECSDDTFTYPKSVFVWKRNDIKLEDKESNKITIKEAGEYSCKLSNSIGSSDEWKVSVTFVDKTKGLEVNTDYADYKVLHEGQELELTCRNRCGPTQNVTWTPPNYVTNYAYSLDIKNGKYALTIKNAKREYAGKYTCKSHTYNGEQLTKDVHVGVPPKITQLLVNGKSRNNEECKFCKGQNVKLECVDDSYTYPKSDYRWQKNNEILYEKSKLTVKKSGHYSCIIANSIGSDSKAVKIKFISKWNPKCWFKKG